MTTLYTSKDRIPYWESAGLDETINTLLNRQLTLEGMATELKTAIGETFTVEFLLQYTADRQTAGGLESVELQGDTSLPVGKVRPDAPGGLGDGGGGPSVFFSTPSTNLSGLTTTVRWYKNGSLTTEKSIDLTINRSADKVSELDGATSGDTVQIALVDESGVVGWWGKIVLE